MFLPDCQSSISDFNNVQRQGIDFDIGGSGRRVLVVCKGAARFYSLAMAVVLLIHSLRVVSL
jgi:hypothetical protein